MKGNQALADYKEEKKGKPHKKCTPKPVAAVRVDQQARTVQADLQTVLQDQDLEHFLQKIGIHPTDILMLFAGFPCETYSYCGHCNSGRGESHGYNFRQSQANGAVCCEDPDCKYSLKAKAHDKMLADLKAALTKLANKHGTKFGIEDPVDEMKNLPFMNAGE